MRKEARTKERKNEHKGIDFQKLIGLKRSSQHENETTEQQQGIITEHKELKGKTKKWN